MAEKKKKWDLTSLHSLEGGAEWIRKQSGAVLVLIVRGEDLAFAVDPAVRVSDAMTMVEVAMPELLTSWTSQRARKGRDKR